MDLGDFDRNRVQLQREYSDSMLQEKLDNMDEIINPGNGPAKKRVLKVQRFQKPTWDAGATKEGLEVSSSQKTFIIDSFYSA